MHRLKASISHSRTEAIRSAVVKQKNWKQEMYQFLRQYRATPHTSTKFSRQRLLCGTKRPCVSTEDNHDNRPERGRAQQSARGTLGDMVLMGKDKRSNKMSSAFSQKPMVVTDIRGTAVTAADPAKYFSFQECTKFCRSTPLS